MIAERAEPQPSLAVWLSRHPFPPELIEWLPGCQILRVRGRWRGPEDAWFAALIAAQRVPDIVFFVAPDAWRHAFIRYAHRVAPDAVLVRPMAYRGGVMCYSRAWYGARRQRVYWEPWMQGGVGK